jgi:hypothetical protein
MQRHIAPGKGRHGSNNFMTPQQAPASRQQQRNAARTVVPVPQAAVGAVVASSAAQQRKHNVATQFNGVEEKQQSRAGQAYTYAAKAAIAPYVRPRDSDTTAQPYKAAVGGSSLGAELDCRRDGRRGRGGSCGSKKCCPDTVIYNRYYTLPGGGGVLPAAAAFQSISFYGTDPAQTPTLSIAAVGDTGAARICLADGLATALEIGTCDGAGGFTNLLSFNTVAGTVNLPVAPSYDDLQVNDAITIGDDTATPGQPAFQIAPSVDGSALVFSKWEAGAWVEMNSMSLVPQP